MEDIRKQLDTNAIRDSVANDGYFNHTKQWFDELYHRPIGERSFFMLLTFLSVLTIFFSIITYFSMFPLSRTIPYTIYSNDVYEELPIITPLKKTPGEDLNLSIARFLVSNYIKERESYAYDVVKLEWQFNRILHLSGESEAQRYRRQVNPENPGSPFNKFGRDGTRDVTIYDMRLDPFSYPGRATVYFTTLENDGKTRQQNNWVANMTFRFPKLTVNQETNEVLQWNPDTSELEFARQIRFHMDEYNVQEITQRRR